MNNRLRLFDWTLIVVPLLLLVFGVVVIYTVTFPTVQFSLARSQILYAVLGLLGAAFFTLIDYRNWESAATLFYALGLFLLLGVLFFGSKQFGASRWIDLGFFQLQPSEIFKLILIVIEAHLLSRWSGALNLKRTLVILALALLPIALVLKQPDLGTASVLLIITLGLLVFARLSWR